MIWGYGRLRIQHNIAALNNYRQQGLQGKVVSRSMEKLSSGQRINRAADDAAGLAISEKMRGQIRGLAQAERNIQDGLSLVKTADAGLGEIANPNLVRLRELAIQAATDTLTAMEREVIQLEVEQILAGIDEIANSTEFNTRPLLNYSSIHNSSGSIVNGQYDYNGVLKKPPVASNGQFLFGTNEGYPTTNADQNQTLVYGNGGTSMPSVRINGEDFSLHRGGWNGNGFKVTEPTKEEGGVYQTVYEYHKRVVEYEEDDEGKLIENVIVTHVRAIQSVSIQQDKYEIRYELQNLSEDPVDLGMMFHLDTMLGNDDHAPFIVNDQKLNQSQVYQGEDIPKNATIYNQATGFGANAEFQAEAVFLVEDRPGFAQPDQVGIGSYYEVSKWDFDPERSPHIGDSGYHVKWNERSIEKDGMFKTVTQYGQSVPDTIIDPTKDTSWFDRIGKENIVLQVGANSYDHFKMTLTDATVGGLDLIGLNMMTRERAEQSLEMIDGAIAKVSKERSKYGAYMNTLEHLSNHVTNYVENLTGTLSQLKDVDLPAEVSSLQGKQVILQAAQTMGAQVNQQMQGVLQLLQ